MRNMILAGRFENLVLITMLSNKGSSRSVGLPIPVLIRALSTGITQSVDIDEDSVLNLDLLPSRIGQAGCLLES